MLLREQRRGNGRVRLPGGSRVAATSGGAAVSFTYVLGDPSAPRGHALLVFRSAGGGSESYASYLIIPPITMDFARYLPPMLASFVPATQQMSGSSAMPVPPIPERVDSFEAMRQLASVRGDDLLDGGSIDTAAVDRMMMAVAEAAQRYFDAYSSHMRTIPAVPVASRISPSVHATPTPEALSAYQGLSEGERIGEVAKLVGQLRYAKSGADERQAREAIEQLEVLGATLPKKYRVDELITAANGSTNADELSSLYIDRCYKLLREEYELLPSIEARIQAIREHSAR